MAFCIRDPITTLEETNPAEEQRIIEQRAGRADKDLSSHFFVPNTNGGLLTSKLRENEDRLSKEMCFRIHFQEAGGIQQKNCFSIELSKVDT